MSRPTTLSIDENGQDTTVSFICGCCAEDFDSTIRKQRFFDQDAGYGICPKCDERFKTTESITAERAERERQWILDHSPKFVSALAAVEFVELCQRHNVSGMIAVSDAQPGPGKINFLVMPEAAEEKLLLAGLVGATWHRHEGNIVSVPVDEREPCAN